MKAASLEILFDYEGQIAIGFQNQFAADGFPDLNKQGDTDDVVTPRYAIKFTSGGLVNQHSTICPDGVERYDMFRGTATIEIYTHRQENADQNSKYVARARSILAGFRKRFGPDMMPYYQIGDIRESGSQLGVMGQDDIDTSTISAEVVFQIRRDAWPDSM